MRHPPTTAGMKWVLLAGVLLGAKAQYQESFLRTLFGAADGLYRLRELITKVDELNAQGMVGRDAFPLSEPRHNYGVNAGEIFYYLQHSMLGLCGQDQVAAGKCFCEDKFTDAQVFRNDTLDSQAAVAVDPLSRVIVVAYRMTVSEKNWISNYDNALVRHPLLAEQQKVHKGHLEYLLSLHRMLEPAVIALLENPKYQGYPLHITGYSLGASAAAISLPVWLKTIADHRLQTRVQLFTFSGPRPGNMEFSKHLDTLGVPVVRYAKQGDVVPHVPDQSMGYSQVGLEFYDLSIPFVRRNIVKCANNVVEDANCTIRDSKFLVIHHLTPFQSPLPTPPFC